MPPFNRLAVTVITLMEAQSNVFYAGDAFASAHLRRHLPGTYLDTTLQEACSVILGSLERTTAD